MQWSGRPAPSLRATSKLAQNILWGAEFVWVMWGRRNIVRDAQRHPGVGHVPCTCSIIRAWLHTCLLPSSEESHGVEVELQAFQPCDSSNSAAYGLMPNQSRVCW